MSFGEAIKSVFSKYATFSGRARRSEYWYFVLFSFLAGIVASLIPVINILWPLAILIPTLAVSVRRLHDTGKSGWSMLLILLPGLLYAAYIIYFIVAMLIPNVGSNLDNITPETIMAMLMDSMTPLLIMGVLELVNFIVLIVWIVWMCKDSEPGTNKWGPNPKEIEQPEFPN